MPQFLEGATNEPVPRIYASCKIHEITNLGMVTLRMNETVVTQDNYNFLTLQDFEVAFEKNSEEDDQEM